MRQYRGKRKDNGEWMYGNYIYLRHDDNRESHFIQEIDAKYYSSPPYNRGWSHDKYEVIPKTVSQQTGLKDKNGKEIYDGDIVEYEDCLRKFGRTKVRFYQYSWEPFAHMSNSSYQIYYEVIGNIHDKPELLK